MVIRLHAVDCRDCENSGRVRVNVTRDPTTGTWDYDEARCITCAGSGQMPAPENYETFTLPNSSMPTKLRWRCLFCSCVVDPLRHRPASDDCRAAEQERLASIRDDEQQDPWSDVEEISERAS